MREKLETLRAGLNGGSDLTALREAYSALENATFEIAEAMYGDSEGEA